MTSDMYTGPYTRSRKCTSPGGVLKETIAGVSHISLTMQLAMTSLVSA